MASKKEIDPFFNPKSIAVIGATEMPAKWGYFTMLGLTGGGVPGGGIPGMNAGAGEKYKGAIYPVNKTKEKIFGLKAYKDVRDIPYDVDAAITAVPEKHIEGIVRACGEKGVRGLTIITAGFGESVKGGREREEALTALARSYGMRLVGPNVGGLFNLHVDFNTTATASFTMGQRPLVPTPLAAVCQGGYALFELIVSSHDKNMGFGKFVQTGNECDLNAVDFLEYFGDDPQVKGIVMYLEAIRDVARFRKAATQIGQNKPIVVYKAGRTPGGQRAAHSHTGAMAASDSISQGLLSQANVIVSPTMELLVSLAHAAIELPPMKGKRVGIMTYGGSWGVPLTDFLEAEGLVVPEFSSGLKQKLADTGLPPRASTKNPVDLGAAGMGSLPQELVMGITRAILESGEVDALVMHGIGRPIMIGEKDQGVMKLFIGFEKEVMRAFSALMEEFPIPVMLGAHFGHFESQAVCDITKEGIRVYTRIDDIAQILSRLSRYWRKKDKL